MHINIYTYYISLEAHLIGGLLQVAYVIFAYNAGLQTSKHCLLLLFAYQKYDIICHKDHKNELYLMVLYTQGYMHPFMLEI